MGAVIKDTKDKTLAAKIAIFIPPSRWRILELLCRELCDGSYKSGETNIRDIIKLRFRLRTSAEISRATGLPHKTVRRIVKELEKAKLVEVQEVGKARVIVPTEEMLELCKRLREELGMLRGNAV